MIEIATDCELIGQVTTQGKILGTMIGQSGPPGPAGPKGDTGNVKFENLTTEQKKELRGENGYTPQKGIDYFTESEVEEIKANLLAETNGNIQKIEEKLHEKDETLNTENKLIKEQIPSANVSGDSLHIEDSGSLDFDWKIRGGHAQAITTQPENYIDDREARGKTILEATSLYLPIVNLKAGNGYYFKIFNNNNKIQNDSRYLAAEFYDENKVKIKSGPLGFPVDFTEEMATKVKYAKIYYNGNDTDKVIGNTVIKKIGLKITSSVSADDIDMFVPDSPSLDYPSEIETVGNNINFINMDSLEEQTTNGLKYSIKDGVLTIKGTATANKTLIFNSKTQVNLKANTYTLNANKSGSLAGTFGYYIYGTLTPSGDMKVLIDGGNLASSTNTGIKTQTLTENNYYNCSFAIYFSKNCTTDMTLTPKLEEGSVATPYSPYNQGSVEIDVVNKNLFDKNTMIELTNAYREYGNSGNIAQLNGFNGLKIPVKSGHKYILSTDATTYNNLCFFDKNMTFLGGYSYNTSFTAPNNCQYVTYAIVNNYTYIQFEEGTTSSDYVEHEQQTAIMSIQQEMLDGDYVADVEHHEWRKLVLTGNENFAQGQNANKLNYFYLGSNSVKLRGKTISNMLKSVENGIIWNKTSYDDIVSSSSNSKTINIMLSDTTITTLQQFKEKLKGLYDAGTPLILYFELATPIDLELTDEQKEVRDQTLYTYKNITNISLSDELANIDVEYRKNLKVNNFTDEDRSKLIPPGGTAGQVLAKNTDTDNDVKWVDQAGGGATVVDSLTSTSTTDALSAKQGKILNDKITNTNTYSTEEVNTGKKWIDGKDIYRKVITQNNSNAIDLTDLTIDTMVKMDGTSNVTNPEWNTCPVNFAWISTSNSGSTDNQMFLQYSGKTLSINTKNITIDYIHIILEYTKVS